MGGYLKCDAEGCDHVEEVGTITDAMVGMPCPKCGANLLTEEDWQAWQPMQAILAAAQALADEGKDASAKAELHVGFHDGTTTIKIKGASNG